IEHLEERGGRIAPEVHAELVDLVEHEERVVGARVLDVLDDATREGPDVRAAVAADLRLVADTPQRQAHELAAHGARDRLAERGLADARRADEAEDGALRVLTELAHGQVLEDAVLDLLEVEVVLVEDLARVAEVEVVLG